MKRVIEPEWLDELPSGDPRGVRSRRDLRRLNFLMGHAGILERTLTKIFSNQPPRRIVELGAGDGTLALELVKKLSKRWGNLELTLVDQQKIISPETMQSISRAGWRVEMVEADVFDWLSNCPPSDCIMTNLFLHHFMPEKLSVLLHQAAAKTNVFVACEPRRSAMGIFGTQFLWAMGCNDVTRHDAPVSVRAGFRAEEISERWPREAKWKVEEHKAGLFSHTFLAAQTMVR